MSLSVLVIFGLIGYIWDVNGWKIKLHTPPSIKVIRAGRETKIDTLGYNMDERVMLNTELEIEFPKQVRVARIVPEEDERDDNKYKWFDLEKYCVELKEGEGLKKWFGWWIIFWLEGKEGTEGKEVPIYVRLKWKDKETGEKYDTGKRIINWIIVKGDVFVNWKNSEIISTEISYGFLHGKTICLGKLRGTSAAYKLYGEYYLSFKSSVISSVNFQTCRRGDFIKLSVGAAYSLFGGTQSQFQFRPFIGFELDISHFIPIRPLIEVGFITEYKPSLSSYFSFPLWCSVNHMGSQILFTSILLGIKYNLID